MAFINASEIGDFVFCERSWWLRKNKYFGRLGEKELRRVAQQFEQGTDYHRSYFRNVRAESSGNRISNRLVMAVIVIAIIVVVLFLSLGRAYGSTRRSQNRRATTAVTHPVAVAEKPSIPDFATVALQLGGLVAMSLLGMSFLYWLGARRRRRVWHIPGGNLVSVDDGNARVLVCKTLALAGRPDAIRRDGSYYVPEERKKSRMFLRAGPRPHHRMQLIAYCYLVDTSVGPVKKGILSYSNGQFEIEYSASAREELIATIRRMRAFGTAPNVNRSHNLRDRCASCAAVQICEQSLAR